MLPWQLSRCIVRGHVHRPWFAARPFFSPTRRDPAGMPDLLDGDAKGGPTSDHRGNDRGHCSGPLTSWSACTGRVCISFSGGFEADSLRCRAAWALALHVCRGSGIPRRPPAFAPALGGLDFFCGHGGAVRARRAALAVDRRGGRILRRRYFAGLGHGFHGSGDVRHGLPHAGEDHQGTGIGGNDSRHTGAGERQSG